MVAPTSTTVPSSITGRNESCCARLNRCTSSTNSSVPLPISRRARAASNTFFRSATPENTAEICSKCSSVASASSLRHRGLAGARRPQKTSEPSVRVSSMRVSAPSGPRIWSWPTTSASERGRSLSGSGRGASCSIPAAAKRLAGLARSLRVHPPSVTLICWPPRTTVMRQSLDDVFDALSRSLVLADLLIVDREDDIALLESDAGGRSVIGKIGHHHAFGGGIEVQLVGHRRRDVGDLGALERRARGQHDLVAAGVGRGLQRHRELYGLAGALHIDLRAAAERPRREAIVERVGIVDRLPVDRDDQVGQFQARPRCRTVRRDIGDQRAVRQLQSQRLGDFGRHRLQARAEPRPLHRLAAALRRGHHHAHHVGGDRKADALGAAGAREDRGVDAGKPPVMSTSAPPELPGLIAASVWMKN